MSNQNLQPIDNRVVVERLESETTLPSGIVLAGKPEESSIAKVLAVGPGKLLENGSRGAMTVQVGNKVLLGKYSGTQTKVNGKEVVVLREDEILAIVL